MAQLCTLSLVYEAHTHTQCTHIYSHTHKQEACLHTKSILHSLEKMKAILIILSTFVRAHSQSRLTEKDRAKERLFYVFPLRQRRQSVNDWVSLRQGKREWEIAQRERKSALSSCFNVCMCVPLRWCVCLRACCLPSITPPLCPRATLCHSHTLSLLSRHWARCPKTFRWHCVCHRGDRAEIGSHKCTYMLSSLSRTFHDQMLLMHQCEQSAPESIKGHYDVIWNQKE